MSLDLKDLRCKITAFAWCHLEGESRATSQDQSEIVREILDAWAKRRHKANIETQRLMMAEGIAGNMREDQGKAAEALRQKAEREFD